MTETPSGILSRAADAIRSTAAAATGGPWAAESRPMSEWSDEKGWRVVGRNPFAEGIAEFLTANERADALWVALLNPAVAGPIEQLLRQSAASVDQHMPIWETTHPSGRIGPGRTAQEVAALVEHHYGPALALARQLLGLENTPEETP